VGQAGYPSDPIHRRKAAIFMPPTKIVAATKSTHEGSAVHFVQRTASTATWAAKPRALTLFTSERPLVFELDDLLMAVDGNGNLSPPQTPDPQHRVIF
jgi:hypothetical protein